MICLICAKKVNKGILCEHCHEYYIYDSKHKFIRRKKTLSLSTSMVHKEWSNELLLYKNLCLIYGKDKVFRQIHPLWAISDKGVLLEYDVAIPSEKLLIEYDGIQHFQYPNFFHKTKKRFLDQKSRDEQKTKLAKQNKFKLIRFNYKEQINDVSVKNKLKEI